MAQQLIGIGSAANDGTGDPARTAGTKLNANFTDLYGMLGVSAAAKGVLANGVADDTAAWAAAFTEAQSTGKRVVYAPPGISNVTGITIPKNIKLLGVPCFSYYETPTTGSILRNTSTSSTTPIVTMSQYSCIQNMTILGSGGSTMVVPAAGTITSQLAGISVATFDGYILDCVIQGCRTGIDMNGNGGIIQRCVVSANHVGIKFPVDTMISSCYVAFNLNMGIDGTNSSDVMLTNSKLEWNNDHNLYLSGSRHWVISNNIIDRGGKTGMYVTGSSWKISVVNNLFWRNGRLSQGDTINDCHWYLDSIGDSTFEGNITDSGVGDSGSTGYDSPAYIMGGNSGTNVLISNNILTGYKTAFYGNVGISNWVLDNNVGQPFTFNTALSQPVVVSKNLFAANAGTDTITWASPALAQFAQAVTYDFSIVARNQGTGASSSCSGQVMVTNESGTAAITRVVTNIIGTTFGLTGSNFNVTASVTANGSSITLTITNSVGASANFQVIVHRRGS